MNWLKSIVVVALFTALLLPLAVLAEEDAPPGSPKTPSEAEKPTEGEEPAEEKPKEAELDEISKKLIAGYEEQLYHLGTAGVKKASFTLAAKMSDAMSGMELEGKATYKWDGEKSTLEWDNSQLGMVLGQQGFSQKNMDERFKDKSILDDLAGTKLTGKTNEDGTTKVTVEGETEAGFSAFTFGADGILTGIDLKVDPGMGQKTDLKMTMTHEKAGSKLLVSTMSFKMELPGMGEFTMKSRFTYVKLGEFTVPDTTEMTRSMAGSPVGGTTTTFSDWKLNDDVK